jgi:hypothetical protein
VEDKSDMMDAMSGRNGWLIFVCSLLIYFLKFLIDLIPLL